ncbi:MAG: hypothetical protein ACTSWY_11085 [Promethearchaeota archaeon]
MGRPRFCFGWGGQISGGGHVFKLSLLPFFKKISVHSDDRGMALVRFMLMV